MGVSGYGGALGSIIASTSRSQPSLRSTRRGKARPRKIYRCWRLLSISMPESNGSVRGGKTSPSSTPTGGRAGQEFDFGHGRPFDQGIKVRGKGMMAVLEQPRTERRQGTGRAGQGPRLGFFRRRFGKWIALSQYGFPFSVGPYSTSVGRFRALARRSRFAWHGRLFHTLANIALTLGWPVGAFFTALKTRARMRERGQAPNGVRVLLDMYWLALRHSIPPLEYALYRFNEPARRNDMHEYVYWNDLPGLAALNARLGADNRDVQDKDRFAEICARRGFPHVPTLAVFERGRQIHPATPFTPDLPQIWTKSLRLKGGAGGAKWIRDGEAYRDSGGRRVGAAKLADEFSQAGLSRAALRRKPSRHRASHQWGAWRPCAS